MDDPMGRRFVTLQATLFFAVAAGPWWHGAAVPVPAAAALAGTILIGAGALLAVAAGARLGRNLTPFPRPRPGGGLVIDGVYRLVRHPIYGGVLLMAVGWAALRMSAVAAIGALLLWWLFERKSRYEERLLVASYPAYRAYSATTRRFLPFLY
jgi:protein-S-isoprenylcysteine O-methyltransferase Ste14